MSTISSLESNNNNQSMGTVAIRLKAVTICPTLYIDKLVCI